MWETWEEFRQSIEKGKLRPDLPFYVSQEIWDEMLKAGQVSESAEERIAKEDKLWQSTVEKLNKEEQK